MSVFQAHNLQALSDFQKRSDQLAIVARAPLEGADAFFQKLLQTPFNIIGKVSKEKGVDDIKKILKSDIPIELRTNPFYEVWVSDMADVCKHFCYTLGSDAISFCLATERGCQRYHVDQVPMRLLVTYSGQGTEWLPDEAADRGAWANGDTNEHIVKNSSARQFMNPWDIALFRGGPKGLLHRTPDAALNGPSILMRLDHKSFWNNILKEKKETKVA